MLFKGSSRQVSKAGRNPDYSMRPGRHPYATWLCSFLGSTIQPPSRSGNSPMTRHRQAESTRSMSRLLGGPIVRAVGLVATLVVVGSVVVALVGELMVFTILFPVHRPDRMPPASVTCPFVRVDVHAPADRRWAWWRASTATLLFGGGKLALLSRSKPGKRRTRSRAGRPGSSRSVRLRPSADSWRSRRLILSINPERDTTSNPH